MIERKPERPRRSDRQKEKSTRHKTQPSKKSKPWYFTNLYLTGENFDIGDYTYGMPKILSWGEGSRLKIGRFCSISAQVIVFLGGNHRIDWVTTYPFMEFEGEWPEAKDIAGHPATKGDVVIGNDVWIGWGTTIMSGVTIGDGAAIGARAVVTQDVEPYSIVGGNPAHLIRKRFDDETIRMLLEIRWWDWPLDRINDNLKILMSNNVSGMLPNMLKHADNQCQSESGN